MKKFILLIMAVFLVSGCGAYQAIKASPVLEASLRITTGRLLEANPSWVAPTFEFTNKATVALRGEGIVDFGVIDETFMQAISEYLIPEEQALALEIFTAIKAGVIEDLRGRGIEAPEEQKAYALKVLAWVNQSAALRL